VPCLQPPVLIYVLCFPPPWPSVRTRVSHNRSNQTPPTLRVLAWLDAMRRALPVFAGDPQAALLLPEDALERPQERETAFLERRPTSNGCWLALPRLVVGELQS